MALSSIDVLPLVRPYLSLSLALSFCISPVRLRTWIYISTFNFLLFSLQDIQSKGPLLYFWYAEAELANSSESSSLRAVHILSCLGSGVKYTPFKCQASSLQLLRAHQGFKERIRTLRSRWAHGAIDDPSIAIICSAALFEGLTTGWAVGIEVLEQAFSMVLPGYFIHLYHSKIQYVNNMNKYLQI